VATLSASKVQLYKKDEKKRLKRKALFIKE